MPGRFGPQRPGESRYDAALRVATNFVGVNEQQEAQSLIEILAKRHGFDLSNDAFAGGWCGHCQERQPCDGALVTALLSKLFWITQAAVSAR